VNEPSTTAPAALRLRDRQLMLSPAAPLLMGVVNVSPESFSDGGLVRDVSAQVAQAEALVAGGAGIIDIGGESGVTGMAPLAADEEIRRVIPLVEQLVGRGLLVSVDTWKPAVARASLEAGAHLINDVSGLLDASLADACAEVGAGLVVMHTRATPKRKEFPAYDDVVADVLGFLRERMDLAVQHGVGLDGIVLDPGPDFAKTPAQTVEVLRALPAIVELGRPVLLAVSRKDFVGALTMRRPRQRDPGTLAAIADGVDRGASILRVHDVAGVRDFLTVRAALRGELAIDPDLALPVELRREPPPAP
jgi:dihydropteroate synthase